MRSCMGTFRARDRIKKKGHPVMGCPFFCVCLVLWLDGDGAGYVDANLPLVRVGFGTI